MKSLMKRALVGFAILSLAACSTTPTEAIMEVETTPACPFPRPIDLPRMDARALVPSAPTPRLLEEGDALPEALVALREVRTATDRYNATVRPNAAAALRDIYGAADDYNAELAATAAECADASSR